MNKSKAVRCAACKYSMPDKSNNDLLRCTNPKVNAKNANYLSAIDQNTGFYCRTERDNRSLLAACGVKGKCWEAAWPDIETKRFTHFVDFDEGCYLNTITLPARLEEQTARNICGFVNSLVVQVKT